MPSQALSASSLEASSSTCSSSQRSPSLPSSDRRSSPAKSSLMSKRARIRTNLRPDVDSAAQFFISASDAARNASASTSSATPNRQSVSVDQATADGRRILSETLAIQTPTPADLPSASTFDVNSAPFTINAIPQWDSFFRLDEDGAPGMEAGGSDAGVDEYEFAARLPVRISSLSTSKIIANAFGRPQKSGRSQGGMDPPARPLPRRTGPRRRTRRLPRR